MMTRPSLLLLCLSVACGRESVVATGAEGGGCYGNGTCNEGLYCSGSGICVRRSTTDPGCVGAACTTDHAGMVYVDDFPGGAFWIDVFEASLRGVATQGSDDQDRDDDGKIADADVAAAHAASHGFVYDDDGGEEDVDLTTWVAQSVPSALPRVEITFYQAAAACTRAGKRLCTGAEWVWACENGIQVTAYPYGNTFDDADQPGVDCWTNDSVAGPQPTGITTGCVTQRGVHDLSGNVGEWTDLASPFYATARGGHWDDGPGNSDCTEAENTDPSDPYFLGVGFRCCARP